jgi:hypothetical protein
VREVNDGPKVRKNSVFKDQEQSNGQPVQVPDALLFYGSIFQPARTKTTLAGWKIEEQE